MAIGFDRLRQWTREYPALAVYAHHFDKLGKRAQHVRSCEVEELLSQMLEPFQTSSATHGILANADLIFKPARGSASTRPVEVTHSKMRTLLASPDRKLRRSGWQSYADAHLAYKNTMANCLAAGIKQDVLVARARQIFLRPGSRPGGQQHPRGSVSQRHRRLSGQPAGLAPLLGPAPVRRLASKSWRSMTPTPPWVRPGSTSPTSRRVEWIAAGLQPMGEDYVAILRKGALQERWVDSVMNKGKRFGAFSSGIKGTHPFIMMSYDRSIFGLSTLAHELGHSMHSYYTGQNQPYVYSRYSLFVAEVASNFHQAMVRAHLLETRPDRDFHWRSCLRPCPISTAISSPCRCSPCSTWKCTSAWSAVKR